MPIRSTAIRRFIAADGGFLYVSPSHMGATHMTGKGPDDSPVGQGLVGFLRRLVAVEAAELGALLWSFAYFFLLLCSYYILRPLHDEMGVAGGVQHLPWVFHRHLWRVMLAAVPLAPVWAGIGYALGRRQEALRAQASPPEKGR